MYNYVDEIACYSFHLIKTEIVNIESRERLKSNFYKKLSMVKCSKTIYKNMT